MTMITPSSKLTLTKGNKSWYRAPLEVDGIDKLDIEFLQPGGSTSSRAAATAVELQFAL